MEEKINHNSGNEDHFLFSISIGFVVIILAILILIIGYMQDRMHLMIPVFIILILLGIALILLGLFYKCPNDSNIAKYLILADIIIGAIALIGVFIFLLIPAILDLF
jgi:hypothetical protein